jgi:hypothetical protein
VDRKEVHDRRAERAAGDAVRTAAVGRPGQPRHMEM